MKDLEMVFNNFKTINKNWESSNNKRILCLISKINILFLYWLINYDIDL